MKSLSPDYVAGLFDGEGLVGLYSRTLTRDGKVYGPYAKPIIQVGVNYRPVLELLIPRYGGKVYLAKTKAGYKDAWQWKLTGRADCLNFLNDVLPLLREKREQAHLLQLFLLGYLPVEIAEPRIRELKRSVN